MPPLRFGFLCSIALALAAAPVDATTPTPSRDIASYVLFAYDEMILKGAANGTDHGYVHGGDIGVNFPGRGTDGSPSLTYASIGQVIMDPGSNAVADSIRASNPEGVFFNVFANSVNVGFDPTILGAGPLPFTTPIIAPADLPVLPFAPGRALTDDASDVLVGVTGLPSPHTLPPGAYRDVRVNDGGTVNLVDGLYDMRRFSVGTNVTVNLTDQTVIQIDRDWSVNDGLQMGVGTQSGARVLVGGLGFTATQVRICNFAHNAEIRAQFFAPTGWLDLGGSNRLFGRYWAQRITGDPSNDIVMQEPPGTTPPDGGTPRRYQCYEIHRPVMNLRDVSLVDPIGASTVMIKRAKRICAPADVDGQDPSAPLEPGHLTYYTLRQTSPFTSARAVVTNALGTATVTVLKPDRLLVPTAKSLVTTPGAPPAGLDHFKCYRLVTAKTRASGIAITDQFGSIVVDIKKPLHLCLAASKNGEPVPSPEQSLTCYQVRGRRPDTAPASVFTSNQFGPDHFGFFGPRDLCLPSTVVFQ